MRFESSLSKSTVIITLLVFGILLLANVLLFFKFLGARGSPRLWSGLAAAGSVFVTLYLVLQAPRAVEIENQELRVVRSIGAESFSLANLRASRELDASAMKGAVRVFGVGGFLGWWGRFRSSALGGFRLYATRLDRLVLLEFDDGKVVVSVDDPATFLRELGQANSSARSQ